MSPNIRFIPADQPFAATLAGHLLHRAGDDPLLLARLRVLLPTRRACRTMREIFLDRSDGRPLLLPRLQPVGDTEEAELALADDPILAQAMLDLPPAMPARRRLILLARAVIRMESAPTGFDQALALAEDLARLLDQMQTRGVGLDALDTLVEGEHARHWEITTRFLRVLSEVWPAILAAEGMIDAADRRDRLLRLTAAHWRASPPHLPVIAAGATGTIPAIAGLLAVIAELPLGMVILPGLDAGIDAADWAALEPTHPQAGLKNLLATLGIDRSDIAPLDGAGASARVTLAREMMRPAATSGQWSALADQGASLAPALMNLTRCDCADIEEEAKVIALIFRATLERPGRTAALVTPDRELARRVAGLCRRWGLAIDDSAGRPLKETPAGHFLRLVGRCGATRLAPVDLLALLRHRHCAPAAAGRAAVAALEKHALRGSKPPPGFAGLRQRLAQAERRKAHAMDEIEDARRLVDRLQEALDTLLRLCGSGAHPASLWLDCHLRAVEALGPRGDDGASLLWQGEDGEAAAALLADLAGQADILPPLDAAGWMATLTRLMGIEALRPRYGTHARLAILGRLEGRLIQADTVVMGSLNEGMWPAEPSPDPFLSRPMRRQAGLPPPEEAIGEAAHDFVQNFCAGTIVMTRSLRQGGAPTTPSRWLQRLDTVLLAADAGLRPDGGSWIALARGMDRPEVVRGIQRPAPCPPVAARPRNLPVTAIANWLNDPYSVYAKYILDLKPLEPLERAPDAASRGLFLHAVLNDFVAAHRDTLPPDAARVLRDLGDLHLRDLADGSGFWMYWLPRFDRIVGWIVGHEAEWRGLARNVAVEVRGETVLQGPAGPFTLTARADRLDRLAAGGMAVIDYKTGSGWSSSGMKTGREPQLPLEGLILERGGFPGQAGPVRYLGYWKLTGGAVEGEIEALAGDDAAAAVASSLAGLEALIAAYDDPGRAYLSLPDPRRAPRFQDYAHLARVQEWTVAGEAEE